MADPLKALRRADCGTDSAWAVVAPRWRAGAGALLVVLWLAAAWIDQTWPMAGVGVLLGLSLSTGLVHGALDAQLLLQRFTSQSRALAVAGAYLVAVLAVGATLSDRPVMALFALLALSAWHFGESYGRWPSDHPWFQTLTRVVVGGAPVLLFPWLVPNAGAVHLLPWLPLGALQAWRGLGVLWLALFVCWAGGCGPPAWRSYRYAWIELAGIGALHLSLSPLMAFALYFGAYHAPVHIWRVWRSGRSKVTQRRGSVGLWACIAVLALTVLLGALLWNLRNGLAVQPFAAAESVRWLVVSLAALTLPHLVLISACARILSPPPQRA